MLKINNTRFAMMGLVVSILFTGAVVLGCLYVTYFYYIIDNDFKVEHVSKMQEYLKQKYTLDFNVVDYSRNKDGNYDAVVKLNNDPEFTFWVLEVSDNNLQLFDGELYQDNFLSSYLEYNVSNIIRHTIKDCLGDIDCNIYAYIDPRGIKEDINSYLYNKYKNIKIPINYFDNNFNDKFIITVYSNNKLSEDQKAVISNNINLSDINYSELRYEIF